MNSVLPVEKTSLLVLIRFYVLLGLLLLVGILLIAKGNRKWKKVLGVILLVVFSYFVYIGISYYFYFKHVVT